jgi:hypothetical protein
MRLGWRLKRSFHGPLLIRGLQWSRVGLIALKGKREQFAPRADLSVHFGTALGRKLLDRLGKAKRIASSIRCGLKFVSSGA